jgi:CTD small phosphatase-like protein 2
MAKNKEGKRDSDANLITSAPRVGRKKHPRTTNGGNKIPKEKRVKRIFDASIPSPDQSPCLAEQYMPLDIADNMPGGLETPLINSSCTRPTPSDGGDTVSTDASTGTSASLEHDEDRPTRYYAWTTKFGTPSSSNSSLLGSEQPQREREVENVSPTALVTNKMEEEASDVEFTEIELDPFAFIKILPPLRMCVPPRTEFLLPRLTRHSSKKKTLVLDLDETLVHSTLDGSTNESDFVFPVDSGLMTHLVSVRKRPFLHEFLSQVAKLFEVVVFTASQQIYAEQLLDIVDPDSKYIQHRVYRDSCVVWEGNYLKDLTVLGRDLAQTIIVDNSPQAFGFQLENGVPIESWYDDDNDTALLQLIPFLEQLIHVEDVRPVISKKFGLRELVKAAPDILFE